MNYLTCPVCGWVGEDCDTVLSWPVTSQTIDEPFLLCPACGSPDLEDAKLCESCGLPVEWCECEEAENAPQE